MTVLPDDINWHLIGHLQRKKVKKIIGKAQLIHSVDSFALLEEINKLAERNKISTSILLQFKIAQEETKYGFDFESFCEKFNPQIHLSDYVSINGVMVWQHSHPMRKWFGWNSKNFTQSSLH